MKINNTDMKSLMEMAGVPMDSPKVQKLIKEGIEDLHADVMVRFDEIKSKLSPEQVAHFTKLNAGFDAAYGGNDPHGNSEMDYLNDMKEIVGL